MTHDPPALFRRCNRAAFDSAVPTVDVLRLIFVRLGDYSPFAAHTAEDRVIDVLALNEGHRVRVGDKMDDLGQGLPGCFHDMGVLGIVVRKPNLKASRRIQNRNRVK